MSVKLRIRRSDGSFVDAGEASERRQALILADSIAATLSPEEWVHIGPGRGIRIRGRGGPPITVITENPPIFTVKAGELGNDLRASEIWKKHRPAYNRKPCKGTHTIKPVGNAWSCVRCGFLFTFRSKGET